VGPLESVCKSTQRSSAESSPAEYCLTDGWLGEGGLMERRRTRRHLSSSASAGQPRCRVEGGVKAVATRSDTRAAAWLGSKAGSSRPALEPWPSPLPSLGIGVGVDGLAVARGWARERSGAAWEQHGN